MRRLPLKSIGIAFGGLIVLLIIAQQTLHAMIDTDQIAESLQQRVKAMTGRDFIHGEVRLSVFPSGSIRFEGAAIKNVPKASATYFIRTQSLRVHFSLIDVIVGKPPSLKSIELVGAKMELERFLDGSNNWSFLEHENGSMDRDNLNISITNGQISFTNHREDYFESINNLNGSLAVNSSAMRVNLTALIDNQEASLAGNCNFTSFTSLADYDAACNGTMQAQTIEAKIDSRVIMKAGLLTHRSNFDANASDARLWLDLLFSGGQENIRQYLPGKLPLTIKADIYSNPEQIIANMTELASGSSAGSGSYTGYEKPDPQNGKENRLALQFTRLDLDELVKSTGRVITKTQMEGELLIPKEIAFAVQLQAAELNLAGVPLRNAVVQGALEQGEIAVNNATAGTPQQGQIITIGRITSDEDIGLTYNGQLEAWGESLREITPLLGIDKSNIPQDVFAKFRMRMNMIIRKSESTFSEIRLVTGKEGETQVAGGINLYQADAPRVEASFAINRLDLSSSEKLWLDGKSLWDPYPEDKQTPFALNWLKDLPFELLLQVELKDYRLFNMSGEQATLLVKATPNRLVLQNIKVRLGGSNIEGELTFEHQLRAELPYVSGRLNISELHLGNSFLDTVQTEESQRVKPDTIWSDNPINMNPLHYANGNVELRIRRLVHDRFEMSSFRGTAKLEDKTMDIDDAKMVLWGGEGLLSLQLDADVVPGAEVRLDLSNANAAQMLTSFVKFTNVNGIIAISSKFVMSGLNFNSWMDNISGSIAFDLRNAYVNYFNLPAVIRSIGGVRSVAGLDNGIRLALEKGATRFGNITGGGYFTNGQFQLAQVTIRSNESVGDATGSIMLKTWQTDMLVRLGLNGVQPTNYPYLGVKLSGPVEMPASILDTRNIEAFIARKIR